MYLFCILKEIVQMYFFMKHNQQKLYKNIEYLLFC